MVRIHQTREKELTKFEVFQNVSKHIFSFLNVETKSTKQSAGSRSIITARVHQPLILI